MKLPRNVSARELIKALAAYGYTVTRHKGSHIRQQQSGEHHVTVPDHDPRRDTFRYPARRGRALWSDARRIDRRAIRKRAVTSAKCRFAVSALGVQ